MTLMRRTFGEDGELKEAVGFFSAGFEPKGWVPYGALRGPLAVNVSVALVRKERGTCASCGKRRVRFQLQSNTGAESDAVCGRCAGMRG